MPRHSPNALTSHLRVHTTNDKPELGVNDADDCFLSQPNITALIVMTIGRRRTAFLKSIEPARHRLKNPFTMSKRSEEHPSELQSLMRISYAVLCLKNKMC